MQYRREIDGLRAVAVLPVIFFHAGLSVFSGGYVGVDIFFVISGYLITSILIRELEQGDFSIARFYERRARRILPALFTVMLACIPFAYLWMLPLQMKEFAQSIVAVLFFVSNILFWRETGYFSEDAELQPLLHTWSLAVEEQYYLLFPIFLLLVWKFGRSHVFWAIVALSVGSLLASEWGWRNKPSANFYLAPTRAWELFAGSICAFLSVGKAQRKSDFLGLLGLGLIAFSIFYYDATVPFPSVYSLVPVVGTALIILFADKGTLVARLLSTRAFVGIGLISYSAYLWHQPLFAFARLRSLAEPNQYLMLSLAFAALVLAWGTWYWIEQPFRKPTASVLNSQKRVFVSSGIVGAIFVAVGLVGYVGNGLSWRLDSAVQEVLNFRPGDTTECHNGLDAEDISRGERCLIGAKTRTPSVAILGDSHVSRLTDALSEGLLGHGMSAITYNGSWCVPLANFVTNKSGKDGCLGEINAAINEVIQDDKIEYVILFAEWANYTKGFRWPNVEKNASSYLFSDDMRFDFSAASPSKNLEHFDLALDHTLDMLHQGRKKVVIILPTPELHFHVPYSMARSILFDEEVAYEELSEVEYFDRTEMVRKQLVTAAEQYGSVIVDPYLLFCGNGSCSFTDHSGRSLYEDSNHMSFWGAERIVDDLFDKMSIHEFVVYQ